MAACQLKKYREDEECPGRVTIEVDGSEEWAVERIISKRRKDDAWIYLIKWHGWSDEYNTWEPASNLTHCPEVLAEFEKEMKRKRKQRRISAKKASVESGEPGRFKTEQGESEETHIAVTSGRLNVKVEETLDDFPAENEDKDEELSGFSEEISEIDRMWLGTRAHLFRRKWRPTEEPLCIVGSALVSDALVHMVRIRCPNDPEVIVDPEGSLNDNNFVYVLSKMFEKKYPQILISYYESRLEMMDQLKSDENLVRDAARAGLVHNLLGAKVDAKYRTIYKDMMPSGLDESSVSDDDTCDDVPQKQIKNEEGQKEKKDVKEEKDSFGLPFYYSGEGEGTFGSDNDGSSDDSDGWEEVKSIGKHKKLTKKQVLVTKE